MNIFNFKENSRFLPPSTPPIGYNPSFEAKMVTNGGGAKFYV
jgi:hypothetical protein